MPHRKNIYHFNKSKLSNCEHHAALSSVDFSNLEHQKATKTSEAFWILNNLILSPIKSTAVILIEVGHFSILHTVDGRNLANHTGMYKTL